MVILHQPVKKGKSMLPQEFRKLALQVVEVIVKLKIEWEVTY